MSIKVRRGGPGRSDAFWPSSSSVIILRIPADFPRQYPDKPPEWRRMFSLVYGELFPDRVLGTEHDLCFLIRCLRETGAPKPKIFHIWGDRDVARRGAMLMNRDFLAMDDPFPYFGAEYPGKHDFDFWDAHLGEMFDFFGLTVREV